MQAFVQLPPEIQNLILVGATLLVGFVFAKAAEYLPLEKLSKYFPKLSEWIKQNSAVVSVSIAGVVVQLLQGYLNQIPAIWENVVTIAFQLLVTILATLKVFDVAKNRKVKYFRTL